MSSTKGRGTPQGLSPTPSLRRAGQQHLRPLVVHCRRDVPTDLRHGRRVRIGSQLSNGGPAARRRAGSARRGCAPRSAGSDSLLGVRGRRRAARRGALDEVPLARIEIARAIDRPGAEKRGRNLALPEQDLLDRALPGRVGLFACRRQSARARSAVHGSSPPRRRGSRRATAPLLVRIHRGARDDDERSRQPREPQELFGVAGLEGDEVDDRVDTVRRAPSAGRRSSARSRLTCWTPSGTGRSPRLATSDVPAGFEQTLCQHAPRLARSTEEKSSTRHAPEDILAELLQVDVRTVRALAARGGSPVERRSRMALLAPRRPGLAAG